jgi:hypothetical protein
MDLLLEAGAERAAQRAAEEQARHMYDAADGPDARGGDAGSGGDARTIAIGAAP